MTTLTIPELLERIEYPDCDGQPMSDSTLQWFWMVLIKEGLEALFADDPNVFVAGNLLWYPVEGDNRLRAAPDVFVAVGRPKGERGSYMQWREGGQPPQVVFEVLSTSNSFVEMLEKTDFYDEHGVEEFYIYDPARGTLRGSYRHNGVWQPIPSMQNWVSPRLKIVFRLEQGRLILTGPDGQQFLSTVERARQLKQEKAQTERQRRIAEQERQIAEEQRQIAKQKTQDAEEQRLRAEEQRRIAEQKTQVAEEQRLLAEEQRLLAEEQRLLAEEQRQYAERETARAHRLAEMLRASGIDPDVVE